VQNSGAAEQSSPHNPAEDTLGSLLKAFPGVKIPAPRRGFLCVLLDVLCLGVLRFYTVPQGYYMVVMAFQKYRTYRGAGLSSIVSLWGSYQQPWPHLVPSQERLEQFAVEGARTTDGIECHIEAFFSFKIVEPGKALFEIFNFSEIKTIAISLVRDECGKRQAAELLRARAEMSKASKENLKPDADRWGLEIPVFDVLEIRLKD
jgi:regulator of protease activity HflC (stomatin/prohibitin superfamily)